MKRWITALLFGICALVTQVAVAQDMDSLKAIMKEDDSPKKLDEMVKWFSDNGPTGRTGRLVRQVYFSSLFSTYKDNQKQPILDHLHALIDAVPAIDKDDANREVANTLISHHVFPQDAVAFAQAGVTASNVTIQKHHDEDLANLKKSEDKLRGVFLSTLGQAEVAAGDKTAGFRDLSQAFALIPTDDDTTVALAKLDMDNGKPDDALNALMPDIDSLTAGKEVTDLYVSIYTKSHNVTPAAANAVLDSIFAKDEAALMKVTRYAGALPAHPHTALVELFSSTSCQPCRAADLAADAIPERYTPAEAITLVYHQNVPEPDPLSSQETSNRGDFYGIDGTPSTFVNGKEVKGTGGDSDDVPGVFEKMENAIDPALTDRTAAEIHLTGSVAGNRVSGQVVLNGLATIPGDLRLQILLVESPIHYVGTNAVRIQAMVVRDMFAKGEGIPYDGSETQTLPFTFDLAARSTALKAYLAKVEDDQEEAFHFDNYVLPINTNNLYVAAFVQNTKTKEVIQTSIIPLAPSGAPTSVAAR